MPNGLQDRFRVQFYKQEMVSQRGHRW